MALEIVTEHLKIQHLFFDNLQRKFVNTTVNGHGWKILPYRLTSVIIISNKLDSNVPFKYRHILMVTLCKPKIGLYFRSLLCFENNDTLSLE